jgi:hypothetical protein
MVGLYDGVARRKPSVIGGRKRFPRPRAARITAPAQGSKGAARDRQTGTCSAATRD